MNVRIAGGDRPVRAHGTPLSPMGLLPASDNAKWVGMLVSFALGLILSTAHIAGSPAPFGLAFLAAMGYGSGGALCLVGCALGYFAAFGVASGTQLAAGCCLIFLTAYFLRSRPFVQTRWYPPLVSAAAYIPTRLVLYLLTGGVSLLLISRMALFLILCAGAAYGFDDLLRAQEPRTANAEICRNVSAVFLLACLLMGVNNLLLFDTLSVGRALSVLILLVLSGTGGALCGASAGVILGIAMDVAAGDGVLFSVVYAAAGLLSGQFCKHRRGFFLSTFAAAYLLALFCVPLPALRIGASAELLLAVGAYLVLPKKFVVAVGAFLQPMRAGSGESGLRRYVAGRVGGMAHAYQQLHDTASQAAAAVENDADAAKIFDRAADRVCCRCKLQQECWTRRALDTLNIMNDATRRIQTRGRLLPEDFPPYFRDRCVYLHEYTEVVNGELRLRAYRQRMQETLQENRTVLWQQYADFAQVLTNVSRELDSGYGADPLAEQRLIRYLRTVGVEADAAVFRESTGRLRVTIDSRYLRPLLERASQILYNYFTVRLLWAVGRPTGSLLGLARRCRENAHLQPLLTVEQPIQFVEVNEGDATAGKMQVVAQVQEYIKNHLSEKLTLADVAAVFNFSPNYLSQLFGKYGDSGFVEYITETRIAAAKEMLEQGDLKVYEIAEKLGYESAFYFSKVFKKVTGLSPREYQQSI